MKSAKAALQLLASAALMWLLLSQVGIEQLASRLVLQSPAAAVLALLLLSLQLAVCAVRWRMVCRALNVEVPRGRTLLGWVGLGAALSQVLPSSIGGDGYRIVALGRRAGLGNAARTVVADRVAGLLTLCVVALAASLIAIPWSQRATAHIAFAVASAGILVGGLFAGVIAQLMARWTASRLVQLVAADFGIMYSRATLLPVFGISMVVHALSILIVLCISAALALDEVAWWQAAVVIPGTVLAMAIPLSLGGWGVRESSMVFGLASFGVPQAAALALSIGYGLVTVAAGVVGLCFWFAGSER